MKDETSHILNDLLADWHRWSKGFGFAVPLGVQPMFKRAKSARGWDTTEEILGRELDSDRMEALDFHINQLCDVYQTALQINARNLYTGKSVWNSARLPNNHEERAKILNEARNALTVRLREVCIL